MPSCDTFSAGPLGVSASGWSGLVVERALPASATSLNLTCSNGVSGGGPHGGIDFWGAWHDGSGAVISTFHPGAVASGASASSSFTPPAGAVSWDLSATPGPTANSNVASVAGTVDCTTVTFCEYGVQPNPDATRYQAITDSLIDLVVAAALFGTANAEWIPYVETALAALEGSVFIAVDCSRLPTGNTNLDLSNPGTYSFANLQSWFQNAAWHFFCQCVPAPPGSTGPITPDKPTIQPPIGVSTTQPPFVCDNTDLCTYLSALKAEVEQVLAQLGILRTDVRLIQRQHVPFAYVPARVHSGLVDAGTFAVQGLLGLSVQLTTLPFRLGEETGAPVALFEAGFVTTGTADGWRRSVPLRHNPTWVDVEPDDTLVGYSFTPGEVANIVEFAREP